MAIRDDPKEVAISKGGAELSYFDETAGRMVVLPLVSNDLRKEDILQPFYRGVKRALESNLDMRYDGESKSLVLRDGRTWRAYGKKDSDQFWHTVWQQWEKLEDVNWSVKRLNHLYEFFFKYPKPLDFDTNRYFELSNAILDTWTGELDYDDRRHLHKPTFRYTPLAYDPEYTPTPAWQQWYDSQTPQQVAVREWSVASAVCGEYGALLTFGQSRTGKSTLAEGLAEVLSGGAKVLNISQDWGRFQTNRFKNTTYLYDPDAKGSKQQNLANYERLHQMMCGDPIQMEVKGGMMYESNDYGFLEIISNDPISLPFEQSLIDRVRFCLYTYIQPRGDGGKLKQRMLRDKQAWVNYAVGCAIKWAKDEITRPPLDNYQALGWYHWLRKNSDWARLSFEQGRYLSYGEYLSLYSGPTYYRQAKDTVETIRYGMEEISRQLGENFVRVDWEAYEKELEEEYYAR